MTARELRQQRRTTVVVTPRGGMLYVKHFPRRVKKVAKRMILGSVPPRTGRQILGRYLVWQQDKDQSHRFRLPKKKWAQGPWQDEPDEVRFMYAGLRCIVWRNMDVTGTLNGYVAVRPGHPWWGKDRSECAKTPQCDPDDAADYDSLELPPELQPILTRFKERQQSGEGAYWSCGHAPASILQVHGGITFSGPVADFGKPDLWWFGFDCGHAGDLAPKMKATLRQVYTEKDPSGQEWREHEAVFEGYEQYRDLAYVRHAVEQLAEQLALVAQVRI